MFMKVIYSSIIPQKGYKAITILNMVFVRKGYTMRLADLNHEAIHWEQEKELAILPFYLLYIAEFVIRLIKSRNWHTAYRNISFEQEAYNNEYNENYIKTRKHYAWLKY